MLIVMRHCLPDDNFTVLVIQELADANHFLNLLLFTFLHWFGGLSGKCPGSASAVSGLNIALETEVLELSETKELSQKIKWELKQLNIFLMIWVGGMEWTKLDVALGLET